MKRGRPKRKIPRQSCHIYLTDAVIKQVTRYQESKRAEGQCFSFSDAVENLLEAANRAMADTKLRPAEEVLGHLSEIPEWVQVDANNGKRVRCVACQESHEVLAKRFGTMHKEIASFVQFHRECGYAATQEDGS